MNKIRIVIIEDSKPFNKSCVNILLNNTDVLKKNIFSCTHYIDAKKTIDNLDTDCRLFVLLDWNLGSNNGNETGVELYFHIFEKNFIEVRIVSISSEHAGFEEAILAEGKYPPSREHLFDKVAGKNTRSVLDAWKEYYNITSITPPSLSLSVNAHTIYSQGTQRTKHRPAEQVIISPKNQCYCTIS